MIHQRYYNALRSDAAGLDPALQAFLQNDVPRLLSIASVASAFVGAVNAEQHRQASEQLVATVRGLQRA